MALCSVLVEYLRCAINADDAQTKVIPIVKSIVKLLAYVIGFGFLLNLVGINLFKFDYSIPMGIVNKILVLDTKAIILIAASFYLYDYFKKK